MGYRWHAARGAKPLFAFGHGLSYTRFSQHGLKLSGGNRPMARITLTNTGARAGRGLAQIYLTEAAGRPVRRLVGFASATLAPGASRTLTMAIDPRLLARWSGSGWTIEGGRYRFAAGEDAETLQRADEIVLPKRSFAP